MAKAAPSRIAHLPIRVPTLSLDLNIYSCHNLVMHDNYKTYVTSRILANSVAVDGGCLIYGGGCELKHKYGLVSITIDGARKSVPAHRALWMGINDRFDLSGKIHIRHKCDNPRCVNIEHLEIGSAKDNMEDCIERGRRAKKYKPHTRCKKLTDDDVRSIRLSTEMVREISLRYGISIGQVSRIRNGTRKQLVV